MLEVMPPEEGKGENRETTASAKEALKKGGIEHPSLQGEKRTASEDPEAKAQSGGRNLHRRVLRPEKPRPHYFPKGISPPASRK